MAWATDEYTEKRTEERERGVWVKSARVRRINVQKLILIRAKDASLVHPFGAVLSSNELSSYGVCVCTCGWNKCEVCEGMT